MMKKSTIKSFVRRELGGKPYSWESHGKMNHDYMVTLEDGTVGIRATQKDSFPFKVGEEILYDTKEDAKGNIKFSKFERERQNFNSNGGGGGSNKKWGKSKKEVALEHARRVCNSYAQFPDKESYASPKAIVGLASKLLSAIESGILPSAIENASIRAASQVMNGKNVKSDEIIEDAKLFNEFLKD